MRIDVYKRQTVHREEVTALDESVPVLVASGPLTEGALAEQIAALTGSHRLSFFDAVAPIVSAESLDMEKVIMVRKIPRNGKPKMRKSLRRVLRVLTLMRNAIEQIEPCLLYTSRCV